jgi:hypothetical protein
MNEPLVLRGLDASNPLAFLAALGTLRSLNLAWPSGNVSLHWGRVDGLLRPFLTVPAGVDERWLLAALIEELRRLGDCRALTFSDDLAVAQDAFRKVASHAQEHASARSHLAADFIAAFASDVIADSKSGIVQDTAWRTMSGAGHQHFLGFIRVLAAETTMDHLRYALFAPWTYSDPPPSLRWDPMDDRRYALRWSEPSGDPIRTVRGANALAIQGLPLFPAHPEGGTLVTTGFRRIPRQGTFFTWPVWEKPLTLEVIRSLLGLRELQDDNPPHQCLRALGIVEAFRSQRITQGKYRNFTQGVPV